MTRVLGLDLSLDATGVALPSGQLDTILPRLEGDKRLVFIEEALDYYVRNTHPDVAVIEKVPESLRGGFVTVVRLGAVHGVARLVLARHGVPFVYIPVSTLKKYATGSGVAKKPDMVNACRDIGVKPGDDNQADAAWLRMLGRHRYDRILPSPMHGLALASDAGKGPKLAWPDLAARPHSTRTRGRNR